MRIGIVGDPLFRVALWKSDCPAVRLLFHSKVRSHVSDLFSVSALLSLPGSDGSDCRDRD